MIDRRADLEAWAIFSGELEDGHEHLRALLCRMAGQDDYGEAVFRIDLGHIYAHLSWT